jgi:hypothetical protein
MDMKEGHIRPLPIANSITAPKNKGATERDIDAILDKDAKSTHRTGKDDGERRKYRNLLDKRFDIGKLIRIERSGDEDDISNKWCDFSSGTYI